MLYISEIELYNFRCFKHIMLETDLSAYTAPWTLLTGDNASGKTTLLKAIALGLCDRSSAAGLLRESDSGYIRHGQDSSKIEIRLRELNGEDKGIEYGITTELTRLNSNLEHLEQETNPAKDFPWDQIFVCGYGAGRGTAGSGDITGYTAISAVYNLFNYSEGLQNPELTIRRLQPDSSEQKEVFQTIQKILDIRGLRLANARLSDTGITVKDPRGIEIALRDLADGYKSTFLWLTDFLGWSLAKQRVAPSCMEGIVVIDELEQHLHPHWQKRMIPTLQDNWPRVQFFAATHSPLLARSFKSFDRSDPHRHYHLQDSDDKTRVEAIQMGPMGGQRTDQILASQAFDYLIDSDPDVDSILEELSLLSTSELTTEEQQTQASVLLEKVKQIQEIRRGQTPLEQSAAEWAEMTRASVFDDLDSEMGI